MAKIEIPFNINNNGITSPISNTETFFDITYTENNDSAVDSFFKKMKEFNLIIVHLESSTLEIALQKANFNLVLLGQISAVESYMREIIRKLIILDKYSNIKSSSSELTYGAAINYRKDILPEALMERFSFASQKNIIDAFREFLDIKGGCPTELETVLQEFDKICQLRHCMIHRFGKLGSNNAIKLGLEQHLECLEKPLSLDNNHLFETYTVCSNVVLVVNNYLFKTILTRTLEEDWIWDFRRDKNKFKKYFELFYSNENPNPDIDSLKTCYTRIRDYKRSLNRRPNRRS